MAEKPLVVYDGNCGFCKIWVEYSKLLTAGSVDYSPGQGLESVQLVLSGGETLQGARAVFTTLSLSGRPAWLRFYEVIPGFAPISEGAYRTVATHREFFYRLTVLFFGSTVQPSNFAISSWLFLRLLGLVYFCAFSSLAAQVKGLVGAGGVLPASRYLAAVASALGVSAYWRAPSLFWFGSSDRALSAACYLGAALGIAVLCGLSSRILLAALYALYLSLDSVGQEFLSFQWDALLLEAGFLTIFLSRAQTMIWLYRWLLFRLMFLSGSVKLLSHDPAWRSLAALDFHYFTQPLPTPPAWYLAQLPQWFQHLSTVFVFVAELAAPWLIFAPRRLRHLGAAVLLTLQALIVISGNYAFFNLLAIALCVFLFDDRALSHLPWIWRLSKPRSRDSRPLRVATAAVAVLVLLISGTQLLETFYQVSFPPLGQLQSLAAPFEIVNTYGLFAVMTRTRIEIIVQGSNDGADWKDYEFPYKPGDLKRRPAWVAPYQPRLDWQMWFAALGNYESNPWFVSLMKRLLEGSPQVLGLFRVNPFPSAPPRFVRALAFEYRFTDGAQRKATGDWWTSVPRGYYLPPISLSSFRSPSASTPPAIPPPNAIEESGLAAQE